MTGETELEKISNYLKVSNTRKDQFVCKNCNLQRHIFPHFSFELARLGCIAVTYCHYISSKIRASENYIFLTSFQRTLSKIGTFSKWAELMSFTRIRKVNFAYLIREPRHFTALFYCLYWRNEYHYKRKILHVAIRTRISRLLFCWW